MTFADSIHGGLANLSMAMPLLAAGALVASFVSTPAGRRAEILIYLITGTCVGFFGAHFVQPIQAGGWNFQLLFYPFLYAKWFFVGFTVAWGFGTLTTLAHSSSRRLLASVLFTLAAIPLSLTLLDLTYVTYVFQRDRAYWEAMCSAKASTGQLELAPYRLSSAGRESVSRHLHYQPHDIDTSVLTKLHTLGFSALQAGNTSPEIKAAALTAAQVKVTNESSEWLKSKAVASLVPLASNPTLDDETFRTIATIGDYQVISALIRNKSNDDSRMKWLRETIQTRVTEAHTTNDSDQWYVDRLREQLDHLDEWSQFQKTGKRRPNDKGSV
jgi:hypothetical protein